MLIFAFCENLHSESLIIYDSDQSNNETSTAPTGATGKRVTGGQRSTRVDPRAQYFQSSDDNGVKESSALLP